MVAANTNLLKLVRQMAVRDELQTLRLRGRLVVQDAESRPGRNTESGPPPPADPWFARWPGCS